MAFVGQFGMGQLHKCLYLLQTELSTLLFHVFVVVIVVIIIIVVVAA
jgi:hypothetical protein